MKVALVTGATGAIGKAISLQLARDGFNVVVHYVGNETEATSLVTQIEALGAKAVALSADVRAESEVDALITDAVKHFGRLDVVVNNAGITRDGLLMRMSLEDWQRVMDINLTGAFLVCRAASRVMMKQRYGKIINISSVVGLGGNAGQANYSASKAGLIGLTKSIAKEFASRNVTCNAVAPGFIDAGMAASLPAEVKDAFLKTIPLKRAGTSENVATAVSFLASGGADYVTGQVICVDGGMSM